MYSKLEIIRIFSKIKDWGELNKVCNAFLWLIEDEKIENYRNFVKQVATLTFRRIENI